MSHGDQPDASTQAIDQPDPREHALVTTLFDLGRQVTAVLDFDELLRQIPRLMGRLISFEAFAVYLLDERRGELRSAYTVGYPAAADPVRLKPGVGLVGSAVLHEQPLLVNDVAADPRYVEFVPGMQSELVVPLVHKSRPIGALNVLSRDRNQFTPLDLAIARQFAAHVAVALMNARLFERSRRDAEAFETLAEIGREVAAVLDLDTLFPRIAQLARRVFDYRTFGILLLNEAGELEEYYCTLCYAIFDLKRRTLTMANSGLPYPIRCSTDACAQIELPGVPLGAFYGSTYDEISFALHAGDVFVFCTDGVYEAMNAQGQEFTTARVLEVVQSSRDLPARAIVDAVFAAVTAWRGETPPNDDMTAVAVRMTV